MINKKFLFAILALALVFGMMVVGCNGDDDGGNGAPTNGGGSTNDSGSANGGDKGEPGLTNPSPANPSPTNPSPTNPSPTNPDVSGGTLSGTYYYTGTLDFKYRFNSNGTYAYIYKDSELKTGKYTISKDKIVSLEYSDGIFLEFFKIYNENTLDSFDGDGFFSTGSYINEVYVKEGSSYPVSGRYRTFDNLMDYIFDSNGCTFVYGPGTTLESMEYHQYEVTGRKITVPMNSYQNWVFFTLDSNNIIMGSGGWVISKQSTH